MVDLQTILNDHKSRYRGEAHHQSKGPKVPTSSEIPDLFFDDILVNYKLSRIEIMVLMYLYRQVWCRPNLYKIYGISQVFNLVEIAKFMGISFDDLHQSLNRLEQYGFISTIRAGQYFVRKYFTREHDQTFQQNYDNFEV